MSEVFKAQNADNRYVAIKLLHSFHAKDNNFLVRFEREARVLADLNHPNIVQVLEFDIATETPYIVMEYIPGGTLKQKLKSVQDEGRLLPIEETMQICIEIADALAYAHHKGMIHRDIKPANIMFNETGQSILTDFGIVKSLNHATQHTATGAMIGTPAYMSPEQGLGRTGDARSDVYALGILLFQMMTGKLPFDADKPLAVVLKHINEPIPFPSAINANIPEGIEDIVLRALSKNPFDRYQTAQQMGDALRQVVYASQQPWAKKVSRELLTRRPLTERQQKVSASAAVPEPSVVVPVEIGSYEIRPIPTYVERSEPTYITKHPLAIPQDTSTPTSNDNRKKIRELDKDTTKTKQRGINLWTKIGTVLGVLLLLILLIAASATGLLGKLYGAATASTAVPTATATITVTRGVLIVATPTAELTLTQEITSSHTTTPQSTETVPPTATMTPTETPTLTPTMTPTQAALSIISTSISAVPFDMTATIDPARPTPACNYEVELANTYTSEIDKNVATVETDFKIHWVIRNNSECPLPANLRLVYVEGESFDGREFPMSSAELSPQESFTISALLTAPAQKGTYESHWRLVDPYLQPIGNDLTFSIVANEPPVENRPPLTIEETLIPTPTNTPTENSELRDIPTRVPPTATRVLFIEDTETPLPSSTNTPRPRPTNTPRPRPTNTPLPQSTNTPRPLPTNTPRPRPTNTPRPLPTNTPRPLPTNTPRPLPTNTPRPLPTNTPRPLPTNTPRPLPTNTPRPLPTNTPRPLPTNTPRPLPTNTPRPLPTNTPPTIWPTNTPLPQPTSTPRPLPTNTPPTIWPTNTPVPIPTPIPTKTPLVIPTIVFILPTPTEKIIPTEVVVASPTDPVPSANSSPVNFSFELQSCDYAGEEWFCSLNISPYGGGGGPYTIRISDANPKTEYQSVSGSIVHRIHGRRCFSWVNNIEISDEASGGVSSQNLYFDPNANPIVGLLGGQCVTPSP